MANTREIRRRIRSIKNTAQITKAMQMVAASKMRKAQQQALDGRSFMAMMARIFSQIQKHVDTSLHPLLQEREVKKELVLVLTTNKGLCGALNTNLLREVNLQFPKESPVEFVASGRKGVQFLVRTGRNLIAEFELPESPNFLETKKISGFLLKKFQDGEVDRISVAYTQFVNTLIQTPTIQPLLPISPLKLNEKLAGALAAAADTEEDPVNDYGYLFEPGPHEVLDFLLPQYLHFLLYEAVLNSRASEHSSRMVAMKSATDNAKGMVKDLTLEYNQVRQAAITTELLEISTAQMAIGG